MDVAHKWSGEAVDTEIDRLISRRASADLAEDPDTKEELWSEEDPFLEALNRAHQAKASEAEADKQ